MVTFCPKAQVIEVNLKKCQKLDLSQRKGGSSGGFVTSLGQDKMEQIIRHQDWAKWTPEGHGLDFYTTLDKCSKIETASGKQNR